MLHPWCYGAFEQPFLFWHGVLVVEAASFCSTVLGKSAEAGVFSSGKGNAEIRTLVLWWTLFCSDARQAEGLKPSQWTITN